jgi:hypothetical protein
MVWGIGVVGRVMVVTGIGGGIGTRESVCIVWLWASESVSSRTCTKLLIMRRTLLMSRLLVERVDTSFKVDPREWRELEAMKNQ